MDTWVAVILGIIQGLTEFLPVSSSAHLVIFQKILPVDPSLSLFFDTTVHVGTLFAIIVYYFSDVSNILKAVWSNLFKMRDWQKTFSGDPDFRLAYYIFLSTLFTGITGILCKNLVVQAFGQVKLVAYALFCTGVLLLIVGIKSDKSRTLRGFVWQDAVIIGLFQTCALFPGISRSGTTIACAMMLGFTKTESARYSFLLAIPAIGGSFVLQLLEIVHFGFEPIWIKPLIIGFIFSLIFGYLAIKLILLVLRGNRLYLFSIYCWIVAILVLLYL